MKELINIKNVLLKKKEIIFKIKVRVGQPKNKIIGMLADGTVKVDIAAIPEKGRANKELIAFLAKEFDVARGNVKIIIGAASKNKLIKIIK